MSFTLAPCLSCEKINRVPLGRAEAEAPICGNCKGALPLEHGVVSINGTGLQHLLDRNDLSIIVDFWAPWCAPCRVFEPEFQRAAKQLAGRIIFTKMDAQANAVAAGVYGIRSLPTLIFFQNGTERERQFGAVSSEQLLRWLDSLLPRAAA